MKGSIKKYSVTLLLVITCCYANAQNSDSTLKTASAVQPPLNKLNIPGNYNSKTGRYQKIKPLIIPVAFVAYGFISLRNHSLENLDHSTKIEIKEHNPTFTTKLDNYLQYSPALAVYGLNAAGIKGKHNFFDRTAIYALSTIISATAVLSLKKITKVERPDSSGNNSFPSGHTTTAFAAAEFMREEYKDQSPWYGISAYMAATATGILRLYNNKHWVSDVITGAGLGILSTKLAYAVYPAIKRKFFKHKAMNTMIMPYYQNGGGGLSMVYNFNKK